MDASQQLKTSNCKLQLANRQWLRLGPLGAVLRPPLLATLNANGVQRAAHHVVADTRQVLHTAAANQHQRVLLQVVPDAGDIGRHFDPIGQANARHLAERRIRLLRGLREHTDADAALLRADLQRGTLGLGDDLLAPLANELTDSRHLTSCPTERLGAGPSLSTEWPAPFPAVYRNGCAIPLNVRTRLPSL